MLTIIAIMVMAVFGMPLFGAYLVSSPDQSENRGLGWVLLIVGTLAYFAMGGR